VLVGGSELLSKGVKRDHHCQLTFNQFYNVTMKKKCCRSSHERFQNRSENAVLNPTEAGTVSSKTFIEHCVESYVD
jgi:hypothetical protein